MKKETSIVISLVVFYLLFQFGCDSQESEAVPERTVCIRYVDGQVESGNGYSWETAFNTVDLAFDSVDPEMGCEIWIKEGTYIPKQFKFEDGKAVSGNTVLFNELSGNESKKANGFPVVSADDLPFVAVNGLESFTNYQGVPDGVFDGAETISGNTTDFYTIFGTNPYLELDRDDGGVYKDWRMQNVGPLQFRYLGDLKMTLTAGGRLGLGTSTPPALLSVIKTEVSHTWSDSFDEVQIHDGANNAVLNVVGPSNGTSEVAFSDGDDRKVGGVIYEHESDTMRLWVDNHTSVYLSDGKVGIGTVAPTHTLTVNGDMKVESIFVDSVAGADFVFEDAYKLRTLSEVEQFIAKNNHLPDVPSAKEMETKGSDLAKFQVTLLQKVEELTLYTIEQNKRIETLEKQLAKKSK